MVIDISGLNKAQLLVALYNNAKNSAWTEASVYSGICADAYFWDEHKSIYQPRIDAKMAELDLTLEDAQRILDLQVFVGSVLPVYIQMDFTGNKVDTSIYNEAHCHANKIQIGPYTVGLNPLAPKSKMAEEIIAELKASNTPLCWSYQGCIATASVVVGALGAACYLRSKM